MRALVPAPVSVEPAFRGEFLLTPTTPIIVQPADDRAVRVASHLAALIAASPEIMTKIRTDVGEPPAGSIALLLAADPPLGDEGYSLDVTPERITIRASQPAGLFYGVQTLRQLLPASIEYEAAPRVSSPIPVRPGRIVDRPRFAWRGAMLDVARHFFSVADVQRYVDLMALYKLNRLHLHLADDQGWRVEIKAWPNLTAHGGSTEVGGGPGGFYTQAEYAGIVAYAADRHITVVPEIDMPGHVNAVMASYPELNCDGVAPPLYTEIEVGFSALCVSKEITYRFLDDVIREIAGLTGGPYFHVGGDEVKKLTPAEYSQFIERVQSMVQSHGKEMIGWDEVTAAQLLPTSIVQHWRPDAPPELLAKAPRLILSPANKTYLDMKYDRDTTLGLDWAGLIEVRDAYDWDPATLVEGTGERSILGVEAPLWSETPANIRDVEFLAFPRLPAIAEVGWSSQPARKWEDFRRRLAAQAPRWTALGVNFHRSPQVPWPAR